jgi:hypothetical protein
MEICQFAVETLTVCLFAIHIKADCQRQDENKRGGQNDNPPHPTPFPPPTLTQTLPYFLPKQSARFITFAGHGNRALHLDSLQRLCRATRAFSQMRSQGTCFGGGEFSVYVSVELPPP